MAQDEVKESYTLKKISKLTKDISYYEFLISKENIKKCIFFSPAEIRTDSNSNLIQIIIYLQLFL